MRFIGITGGVGAGKTEILKYIGQHYKCEIYLADDIGPFLSILQRSCIIINSTRQQTKKVYQNKRSRN